MLFNEPKLLKSRRSSARAAWRSLSVLFNEPKLLKYHVLHRQLTNTTLSVLFNEPKLLKSFRLCAPREGGVAFSALQRAEIAEIHQMSVYM